MIKNKLKIGVLLIIFLLVGLVGTQYASAQALSFTADATVTIGSANYTASSGGAATSLVIAATTLTAVVPASSTFTFVSSDRYTLNNDQAVSQQCSASQNSISISGPLTIVITPDTSIVCAYSTAKKTSSAWSGSPVADTVAPTGTAVSINAGATTTTSTTVTLTLTATGASDVMVSNVASFYNAVWVPYVSSMSWALPAGDGIKTVYAKYRDTAGNVSAPVQDTIGIGVAAPADTVPPPVTPATPATPAQKEVPGCGNRTTGYSTVDGTSCATNTPATPATPASPSSSTRTSFDFGTKTLKNGSRGSAAMELQRFLNQVLSMGLVVDGIIGPKSIAVIKKWQKEQGLVADGLIGPLTKAKMNASVKP